MQILQVNKYFYRRAGAEVYFLDLIDVLKEYGHEVIPFSVNHALNYSSDYQEFFLEKVNYRLDHPLYWKLRHACRIIFSLHARKRMEALLNKINPEIVHLHNIYHQISPSILPVLKKRGLPVIMTLHDLKLICPNYKMLDHGHICERCKPRRFYWAFLKCCVKDSYSASALFTIEMYIHRYSRIYEKYVDKFVTTSNFYRQKMIEYGIPENKLVNIPNFIHVKRYVPHFVYDDYFLYFGRLAEEKGLLSLIKAMRKVKKGRLYIVGEGPEQTELERMVREYQLKNVIMTGPMWDGELESLIARAKFVVLPSEWYENGPISLIQSYAYGKPVLGANIGGIPEMIESGHTGLLFEPFNVEDLAEKINYLLGHDGMVLEMGKKARRKAEDDFGPELHYDRLLRLYSDVKGMH